MQPTFYYQMTINERVTFLIKKLGLNNNSFSNEIGVNPTVIHNISKGRNSPSFEVLSKITSTFKEVNTHWLITGKGEVYNQEGKILDNDSYKESRKRSLTESPSKKEEIELIGEIESNLNELYYLYQRITDVKILLEEQLSIKAMHEDYEDKRVREIDKKEAEKDLRVRYYETLNYRQAVEYNKSIVAGISEFRELFFTLFRKLYMGLRRPVFDKRAGINKSSTNKRIKQSAKKKSTPKKK